MRISFSYLLLNPPLVFLRKFLSRTGQWSVRDKNFLKKIRVLFGAGKELCFLFVSKNSISHGVQKH